MFPKLSSCSWGGYTTGQNALLNGTLGLRLMAHELGHTYGNSHAKSMSCTQSGQRVTIAADVSACTVDEYGDIFDTMGYGSTRHYTNWQRASRGWLDASGIAEVTASGTYSLAAAEDETATAPRLLKVRRSDGSWLVSNCRPFGQYFDNFSSTDPAVNGITIRYLPSAGGGTRLLDATTSTSSFSDAALAVGKTLSDGAGGVTLRTVAVSGGVATVTVELASAPPPPPPSDATAPSAPSSLSASAPDSATVSLVGRRHRQRRRHRLPGVAQRHGRRHPRRDRPLVHRRRALPGDDVRVRSLGGRRRRERRSRCDGDRNRRRRRRLLLRRHRHPPMRLRRRLPRG